MSVREGAGPLLDNPPQPKRRDSPDGESFGYAATLRAANEKGGERKGLRGWGKGWREAERVRRSGGDSPGGESLDTRRRRSRRQRKGRGTEGWAGIERRLAGGGTGTAKRGDSPDGESLDTRRRFAPPAKGAGSEKGRSQRKRRYGREKYRRVSDSERIWGRRNGKKRNFLGGWRKRDADDEPCAQRARRGVR